MSDYAAQIVWSRARFLDRLWSILWSDSYRDHFSLSAELSLVPYQSQFSKDKLWLDRSKLDGGDGTILLLWQIGHTPSSQAKSAHSCYFHLTGPASIMTIASSSPNPNITESAPVGFDHVRPLLRDHDSWCISVARNNCRHDGRINDSESGNPVNLNIGVEVCAPLVWPVFTFSWWLTTESGSVGGPILALPEIKHLSGVG